MYTYNIIMNNKQTKKCKAREMATSNLRAKTVTFRATPAVAVNRDFRPRHSWIHKSGFSVCCCDVCDDVCVCVCVCVCECVCEERTVDVATVAPSFHKLS
jgi:hypothetical protein